LLAVGIAILLAIVISVSYALVLRELRQINANLEQLMGLLAHDEAMREAPREDLGWNPRSDRKPRGRPRQVALPAHSRFAISSGNARVIVRPGKPDGPTGAYPAA
jgi:hypothetical protein